MHDLQLNLAGLEAVCLQCPAEYRTCTCFHVCRIKVDMEKITDEVHRLMRWMSATEAQSRTLRRMLHASAVSIQPVQQVRTIIFIARQHTDENGLIYRHSLFSPYGSPIILVLLAANIFMKFRRGHPLRGRKIQVWYKNFAISYQ